MELLGRRLSIPVGREDWTEKMKWFNLREFRAVEKLGFGMAFEWKGLPPSGKIVAKFRKGGIFWGIHFPNDFSDLALRNKGEFKEKLNAIARLRPDYVVVHGGFDYFAGDEVPLDHPVERYRCRISAEEYLEGLAFQIKLLRRMAVVMREYGGGRVLLENTPVTEFSVRDGKYTLPTYAHPRVGNWTDLATVAREAGEGVGTLCDIGHLTFSRNFYNRMEEYAGLPLTRFSPENAGEELLWDTCGVGIREGEFPAVKYPGSFSAGVGGIGAQVYHLDGARRESTSEPVDGEIRCDSHAPISAEDERVKQIVNFLLYLRNLVICLEVDGRSGEGGPFDWRPLSNYDTQLESWVSLCQIVQQLAE